MTHKLLSLFILLLLAGHCHSQGSGAAINDSGNAPHPSAMLDVSGTGKGVLINRMTTAERNAIEDPAIGLQIFNTTTNCLNIWVGTTWKQLCGDCDFNSPVASNDGPACEGGSLQLFATSISGATYAWNGPGGFTSSDQNPVLLNVSPADAGSYTVTATLDGCTSQIQSTIATIYSTPGAPLAENDGPGCVNTELNLSATFILGASYEWSGPNGYSANVQNPVITSAQNSNAGLYTVVASISGCESGPGSTTVSISDIPATPGIISGAGSVCPNTTGVVYSISAVPAASTYNWSVPSGASITENSGTSITVSFGANPSGTVSVTAENTCGISSASTLSISQNSVCSPMTFQATGTGANGSIQTFTVPAGVTSLTIEAWGAAGGTHTSSPVNAGGRGARMKGTFVVTPGETLKVLVGHRGTDNNRYPSGGGGTFVTTSSNVPLIVAGGGGGAGDNFNQPAADATVTTAGNNGHNPSTGPLGSGGTNGNGGSGGRIGPAGGGFYTDGGSASQNGVGTQYGAPGQSFLNGGQGGANATNTVQGCGGPYTEAPGGFGGGAGGGSAVAGAGGGYSGGGGSDGCPSGTGGGGGSYNAGTDQSNSAGVQTGNGMVVFSW